MNRALRCLALLCCLHLAGMLTPAAAQARELAEGDLPSLAPGQGYLVVLVDTDSPVLSLQLNRRGSLLGDEKIDRLDRGRSLRVLALDAGDYQWTRIEAERTVAAGQVIATDPRGRPLGSERYDVADLDTAAPFRIEAGRLNYPGDLHLRFRDGMIQLTMPNRGEQAMRQLAQRHGWRDEPAFVWTGMIADRYPAWRTGLPEAEVVAAESCPEPASLPKGEPSAVQLFRPDEVESLALAPAGDLVLEVALRRGSPEVNVIEPATGEVLSIYRGTLEVTAAHWAGKRRVVFELRSSTGVTGTHLIDLSAGPLAGQAPKPRRIPVIGWVLDPLPLVDDALLYGVFRPRHEDPLQVFRVDLSEKTIEAGQFEPRKRIDKGVAGDQGWIADAQGNLRLATVEVDDQRDLLYSPDGRAPFTALARADTDRVLLPQALDSQGRILALSNQGREQMDLVRLDPTGAGELETVHSIPGLDLTSVVRSNATGAVVGVRYFEAGQSRSQFFDPRIQSWQARVSEAFPQRQAALTEVDEVSRRAVVLVSSDTRAATYYLLDVASGRAEELADSAPWLAGSRFVQRSVSTVTADDGGAVQVLLAKPAQGAGHPLLVMPHGGPFYILDALGFDREVQYWATRGFAVVQINFRGSFGFGAQHLLDGLGGFGGRIEDDIETAVASVLADNGDLDGDRVCALGSSYGGYSALMLAIRDPARFKCAVAMAAPTDLPLLFTSSDWSVSATSRDTMARWIGAPDGEGMPALSPLYRVEDLTAPVLLIHGENDRRVDYEHAVRLSQALSAHQRPHRLLRIDGMGHGPTTIAQQVCMLGSAEAFVREQLDLPPSSLPAAAKP